MRSAAVAILLFFAVFGLPKMDLLPSAPSSAPVLGVDEPSKEMKKIVESIAKIMRSADHVDRALWAQVWSKAAKAVEADGTDDAVLWPDTTKLRQLTATALRIGWRRIGGNKEGKYAGLSEETEAAFAAVLTVRQQTVDPTLRSKYVELCRAVAWAGLGRDQ